MKHVNIAYNILRPMTPSVDSGLQENLTAGVHEGIMWQTWKRLCAVMQIALRNLREKPAQSLCKLQCMNLF